VNVCLRPRVGEHVAAGTTLAWIWPVPGADLPSRLPRVAAALHVHVRIGFERTLEQDPGLGMRQLVDVACKALSPAVNDPYTAIQAVHHLAVLYTELAKRRVGAIVATAPAGAACVVVPARSLADHLDVGMGLIRRYGAAEPTVAYALMSTLTIVLVAASDDAATRVAVEHQADLLVRAAERGTREVADLHAVHDENDTLRRLLRRHADR
jgi:uncharacterized membrane protein